MTTQPVPIVCDMTDASDTSEERVAEYQRLFSSPEYVGRERIGAGIRFRFRAATGLVEQIRDLAAREKACCAFFDFSVEEHGEEITWDSSVPDDAIARQILDEYYRLPDTAAHGAAALFERFNESGLDVVIDDHGVRRPATRAELGLGHTGE